MKASVDISLYPLKDKYKEIIFEFIGKLNKNKKLKVETNGMSTQVFGDYAEIMKTLTTEVLHVFKKHKSVFILKIGPGEMRYEK